MQLFLLGHKANHLCYLLNFELKATSTCVVHDASKSIYISLYFLSTSDLRSLLIVARKSLRGLREGTSLPSHLPLNIIKEIVAF